MPDLVRYPHLALNWAPAGDIVIEHASGCELFDQQGRRYLDFTSGISVTNVGHCHPEVVRAIQEQAGRLLHSQSYIALYPPLLELAAQLAAITPGRIDTFFFCNTGAEAVEAGLRLARTVTGRPNIVCFQGGFHGRTAGAMSVTTSNALYRAGALPSIPGVYVAPFPRAFRDQISEEVAGQRCLDALRLLLQTQTAPDQTAALLIEPVQGEGGFLPAPRGFLGGLRRICDQYGILLIVDEIQSGFGRTGKMFAIEHAGVVPDMILLAKGIAAGMPLAALGASQSLMDQAPYGSQGGTYNGNPVACAAATATIDVLVSEDLPARAARQGAYLRQRLEEITAPYGKRRIDIRGPGLMVAIELLDSAGHAASREAREVIAHCRTNGLLTISAGPETNVIRLMPPLVITESQIDEAVNILRAALERCL